MKKKMDTKKALLKTITLENTHLDEPVKGWNSFSENGNTVDDDFMNERGDIIEASSRSIFDDDYLEDKEEMVLIKKSENQSEIDNL